MHRGEIKVFSYRKQCCTYIWSLRCVQVYIHPLGIWRADYQFTKYS